MITKRGNEKMAVATIEDYSDSMEVLLYPKVYSQCADFLVPDTPVYVTAKLEVNDSKPKVVVEEVILLKDVLVKKTSAVQIKIGCDDIDKDMVNRVQSVIKRYPGKCPLYLRVQFPEEYSLILQAASSFSISPGEFFINDMENAVGADSVVLRL